MPHGHQVRLGARITWESPTGTAQKRTHQQDSDDSGNSQRSTFASPTLKRPQQTTIDGEYGVRTQLPALDAACVFGTTSTALITPASTAQSHVTTPNTHSDLDTFLRNVVSTDLSAHRALFLTQGFNREMICIVSRGNEEDVQRVLHKLLPNKGRGLKGKGLSPLELFFLKDVLAKLVQAGPK
ncbi:hypothetical protein B0H11DRAFT_1927845 [Mycena galericulata]|nr:hypothetical protein B0H11DRAFT_1927845 [Mycena galericulata]